MDINKESALFSEENLKVISNLKKAEYVCDTEHNGILCSVFYQYHPPETFDNYFALYYDENKRLMITSGSFIKAQTLDAVVSKEGEVLFSRYRHDYRKSKDGTVSIDGGREYTRAHGPRLELIVKEGNLIPKPDYSDAG